MSWPKVRLGDVCEVKAGRDYKDVESPDGKYPIYGTGGVMGMSREWRCPAGSVIVGRKGTLDNPMLINEPFWNIDTCFGVVPSDKLLPAYLWRFCQNFDFYSLVPASGRPSTTSDAVKAIKLPLPPLAEQKKIVEKVEKALKRVDALKAQFERMEKSAADYFKAALAETFAAVKGEKVKLGDVSSFMTSGSRGWAQYYADDGEMFITIKNVRGGEIDVGNVQHVHPPSGAETERTRVQENDLLISITADLGRTGVVTKEIAAAGAYINQHLICIRLYRDRVDPRFAALYIESPDGRAQIMHRNKEAVKAGLNFDRVKTIELPIPSLEIQREVVKRLTEIKCTASRLEEAARRCIGICGKMRKAILAEAFQ